MKFCEGFFELKAQESNVVVNITFCSDRDVLFHFDLTQVVQDSLPDTITLKDIHQPEQITRGSRVLKAANIVVVILYAIGMVFTGFAALGALYCAARMAGSPRVPTSS